MKSIAFGTCVALLAGACAGAFYFLLVLNRSWDAALSSASRAAAVAGLRFEADRARRIARAEAPVHLLFVGDIMLSRAVGARMQKEKDFRFPFLLAATTTRAADIAIGNLEGPISSRGEDRGSAYSFRADPRAVEGLSFAGFDVLSLANNHAWDWGAEALEDTAVLLRASGIYGVGAGSGAREANEPAYLSRNGLVFGFAAYTDLYPPALAASGDLPGISRYGIEEMKRAVEEMKQRADVAIVLTHWGEEYETSARASEKDTARMLIDAGADLVVGTHPHVVQETERYGRGVIAYSLGNFVFDQPFSAATMRGAMLSVLAKKGAPLQMELIPVALNGSFQPARTDGK